MRALVLTIVVAVLAAVSPWGTPAGAQGRAATDRPVDRIVAVVGTKPILASQGGEQLVLGQSQGAEGPAGAAGGRARAPPDTPRNGGQGWRGRHTEREH